MTVLVIAIIIAVSVSGAKIIMTGEPILENMLA